MSPSLPAYRHIFFSNEAGVSLAARDFLAGTERWPQSKANILRINLQPRNSVPSSGLLNHVNYKPGLHPHIAVNVVCQVCEGRAYTVDVVEKDDRRIVTRTPCPSCQGRGVVDISRGPVNEPEPC